VRKTKNELHVCQKKNIILNLNDVMHLLVSNYSLLLDNFIFIKTITIDDPSDVFGIAVKISLDGSAEMTLPIL
jgi:hypothetical protein